MKKELLILLFTSLFSSNLLLAQKEYNRWYFGNRAGITFNTNPPSALTNGAMYTSESSSGICDKNGNLLFYTNGDTIWNKNHQAMKNGLSSNMHWCSSSIQGSIAVSKPGSDSLYYIFTTNGLETGYDSLRYTLINMKGDNNKGEVLVWNKALLPNPTEGMAVTLHANQKDLWVCALDITAGNFNCLKTVNGELDTSISTTALGSLYGYTCKFSPDGKILYGYLNYSSTKGEVFGLYHFDQTTGLLSDKLEINPPGYLETGFEFSHDSRYLYLSYAAVDGNLVSNQIVQYDLSVWNENKVQQSITTVYSDSEEWINISGMQLGPDKKIYVFYDDFDSLTVIDYPNRKGNLCQTQSKVISLNGRFNQFGGPYYPSYLFRSIDIEVSNDTTICNGDSVTLHCTAPAGTQLHWSTGDTSSSITVWQDGIYKVMVTNEIDTVIDSVIVKVRKKFPVYLGSDTAFCGAFSMLLNAGKNAKSYYWNTGDTTFSILVDQPGLYSVAIRDSNSCPAGDTILIDQLVKPSIALQYDLINCEYVQLDASPRQKNAQYQWNTGDTAITIRVDQKGKYDLIVSNLFCSIAQSIEVKTITGPCEEMRYYIPNAFTPQHDGLNETFKVAGSNLDEVTIRIYNRWGAKIFEGSEWDGTSNGKPCLQDTYVYSISISGTNKGIAITKQVSGTVTLLR